MCLEAGLALRIEHGIIQGLFLNRFCIGHQIQIGKIQGRIVRPFRNAFGQFLKRVRLLRISGAGQHYRMGKLHGLLLCMTDVLSGRFFLFRFAWLSLLDGRMSQGTGMTGRRHGWFQGLVGNIGRSSGGGVFVAVPFMA